jgi:uncharacterized protein
MFKSGWRRVLLIAVRILALVYVGLMILVYLGQRRLIYHPYHPSHADSLQRAQARGFVTWENKQGQFIGWKKLNPTKGDHDRILIVHGNAGCAINRLDYAGELEAIAPTDVFILEYPGFGERAGSPSQESLFASATEAMDLLKNDGPVFVLGESLGTGVAAYLAGAFPQAIPGIFLIAPYNNMTDVAQDHMPIFPVRWLLKDLFPSETYLRNYHGPVGVVLAGQDEVVPNRFGRKLFDDYLGPKKLWELADAGHNDLLSQAGNVWKELFVFWNQNQIVPKP